MLSAKRYCYVQRALVAALLALQVACDNAAVDDAAAHVSRSLMASKQLVEAPNNWARAFQERHYYNEADFGSRELFWWPKAMQVQKLTDSLEAAVQRMRLEAERADLPAFVPQQVNKLTDRFRDYREAVVNRLLDTADAPYYSYQRGHARGVAEIDTLMRRWWGGIAVDAGRWQGNINGIDVLASCKRVVDVQRVIDLLLLDIEMLRNKIASAFAAVGTTNSLCGFGRDIPMVILQSQRVGVGDVVKVIAGIGEPVTARLVTVQIGSSLLSYNREGEVVIPLKAKGRPGRYAVPVSITWLRPDSVLLTWTKNLHYAVTH